MTDATQAPGAPLTSLIPELDRIAADAMADWRVPGAALAVVQDGKLALTRCYGQRDVEVDLPVTPATQFAIGSITKSFTATALAVLHHERRLDWTRPVRDYLPEFRLSDPLASERVTVLDLLYHRTGLARHDWLHEPGDLAPSEMLALLRHLDMSSDLRSAFQYNNLCYVVAGLLIERVSGQSYEAFIRTRLTDRLGMTVGFSFDDLDSSAEPARGYRMDEDTRLPPLRIPITTVASGAMTTSITGLAGWMRLHLGGGAVDGERLLPEAMIAELHVPRVYITRSRDAEFGEAHYGLGFQCDVYRGDRLIEHMGGWPGWNALIAMLPDFGIGVAVLTNRSQSGVPLTLALAIIDRLRGREPVAWRERFRKWRDEFIAGIPATKAEREKARHANTRPAHDLAAYAGDYRHPAYGLMSIRSQQDALQWSWRGLFATLQHRHYETFEIPEAIDRNLPDLVPITFLTDRDGNIASLSAPLEPAVKDIVFVREAASDSRNAD